MELKVLTKLEELCAIQEDWSILLQHSSNKGVYLCYEWCWASYKIFHPKDQLYVLIITNDQGQLSGVAPLVISSGMYRGIKINKIGFLRNDQNPANDFILYQGLEETCLKIFLNHLCRFTCWEFIDLHMVDIDGPTGVLLQRVLLETSCEFGTKSNRQSPFISIDISWEDFWENRSQRFRKTMRNKLNRAKKTEDLVVEKIPLTCGNSPEFDDMLRISANSWKQKIGTDLTGRKDNREFIKSICGLLGSKGFIYVWFLKINQVAVAYEFHIEYENVVYPIRADYDENYKELSPGSILEFEIIRSLFFMDKVLEYHSCGHTYEYLLHWTNRVKDHQTFEVFKKNFKMAILYNFEYRTMVKLRKIPMYNQLKRQYKFLRKLIIRNV